MQFAHSGSELWASQRVPGLWGGLGVGHCARLHLKFTPILEYGVKPRLVRCEAARCGAEAAAHRDRDVRFGGRPYLQLLSTWPVRVGNDPSIFSRWAVSRVQVAGAGRCCEEQFQTQKLVSTSPWRAADGMYLISMMNLNSEDLNSVQLRTTNRQGGC